MPVKQGDLRFGLELIARRGGSPAGTCKPFMHVGWREVMPFLIGASVGKRRIMILSTSTGSITRRATDLLSCSMAWKAIHKVTTREVSWPMPPKPDGTALCRHFEVAAVKLIGCCARSFGRFG